MKEIWCLINSGLILILFVYIMICKDINTQTYNKCNELEEKVTLQEERCNNLSEIATKKDTIVINIKNYNYHQNQK